MSRGCPDTFLLLGPRPNPFREEAARRRGVDSRENLSPLIEDVPGRAAAAAAAAMSNEWRFARFVLRMHRRRRRRSGPS